MTNRQVIIILCQCPKEEKKRLVAMIYTCTISNVLSAPGQDGSCPFLDALRQFVRVSLLLFYTLAVSSPCSNVVLGTLLTSNGNSLRYQKIQAQGPDSHWKTLGKKNVKKRRVLKHKIFQWAV